jgi:hypothetical protein
VPDCASKASGTAGMKHYWKKLDNTMTTLVSVLKYIRARPAIIILTACAFTFFFAVIYFALYMMIAPTSRNMAAWVAAILSVIITAGIVIRHREEA